MLTEDERIKLWGWCRFQEGLDIDHALENLFRWASGQLEDVLYEVRFALPVGDIDWECYLITTGSTPDWQVKGKAETPAEALACAILGLIRREEVKSG